MTSISSSERPAVPAPQAGEPRESWLLRTGLSLTVWALAAIATALAASGQVEFAHWAGITDARAFAVPAVLELVAVAFLLVGYRRARRGDSASALWLLAAVVGGFAVYTNVVHSGGRQGLIFGGASAITMILWFVKLRDDYRHFQRHSGQAMRPRPKLGALWIVAPRLSTRAWVVATRRRISTVDEAIGYAEVWRAVYEDARSARVSKRLARRTAWRQVAEAAGGVWAELPRTAEVAAVRVLQRDADALPLPGHSARAAAGAIAPPAPASNSLPPGPTAASPAAVALRDRVFAYLDERVGAEYAEDYGDEPDAYLTWMTARDLGVSVESVEDHVRDWCRQAASADDGRRWQDDMAEAWAVEPRPVVGHTDWPATQR